MNKPFIAMRATPAGSVLVRVDDMVFASSPDDRQGFERVGRIDYPVAGNPGQYFDEGVAQFGPNTLRAIAELIEEVAP